MSLQHTLNTSLSQEQRDTLHLHGLLPHRIESNDSTLKRLFAFITSQPAATDQYDTLQYLRIHHTQIFYQLMHRYLEVLLPVVYTPTVGNIVKTYSQRFRMPEGVYLSYPNRHLIAEILGQCSEHIKLVILTDGEGVLGIGDWGLGGMSICTSKKVVYGIAANLNPAWILPIHLDVGTDRTELLESDQYLGWQHTRIPQESYLPFIDTVIEQIHIRWPKAVIHWEDFARKNGALLLARYRNKIPSFNDDIQGTGAVACACILAGFKALGKDITQQNIVFFGAGSAGCGIAQQWYHILRHAGLSDTEARSNIWLVDQQGLLGQNSQNMTSKQTFFAQKHNGGLNLYDTISLSQPAALIGCSGVVGAFSEAVITLMAQQTHQPIIMPLSNPTHCAEAIPANILHWSQGNAIIATGSPFEPVILEGESRDIAQCNNAFLFPALALGALASNATEITDEMLSVSCHALANHSPILQDLRLPLMPQLKDLYKITQSIAKEVGQYAINAHLGDIKHDIDVALQSLQWLQPGDSNGVK